MRVRNAPKDRTEGPESRMNNDHIALFRDCLPAEVASPTQDLDRDAKMKATSFTESAKTTKSRQDKTAAGAPSASSDTKGHSTFDTEHETSTNYDPYESLQNGGSSHAQDHEPFWHMIRRQMIVLLVIWLSQKVMTSPGPLLHALISIVSLLSLSILTHATFIYNKVYSLVGSSFMWLVQSGKPARVDKTAATKILDPSIIHIADTEPRWAKCMDDGWFTDSNTTTLSLDEDEERLFQTPTSYLLSLSALTLLLTAIIWPTLFSISFSASS